MREGWRWWEGGWKVEVMGRRMEGGGDEGGRWR